MGLDVASGLRVVCNPCTKAANETDSSNHTVRSMTNHIGAKVCMLGCEVQPGMNTFCWSVCEQQRQAHLDSMLLEAMAQVS